MSNFFFWLCNVYIYLYKEINQTLESVSNIAIDWFTKNEMIINLDKFQAIILDKKKSNLTNIPLTIDNEKLSNQFHH